eukprot:1575652-Prymnesium_polylepis.1
MPAMRPARGWHGAARCLTWRERQRRETRALKHRRRGRLHTGSGPVGVVPGNVPQTPKSDVLFDSHQGVML